MTVTHKMELDPLFGLTYFRGLLDVNLYLTDRLFSADSHFVFSSTMSKNRFRFLRSHLDFDIAEERPELWKTDRFADMRQIWELFSSNLNKYAAPSEYLSIDETLYPMRHQIQFHQYNPKKPHRYVLLGKSLNDTRFSYTYTT